ncbi:MAG: GxxExxY protein [Kiritimatiellae bacterium]|nr:GxxExxY protein [Kiritimatiellia bacterium]
MSMIYERECYAIRGAVFEVYSQLGNGFAEEVYQEALEMELRERGIPFEAQPRLRIRYKDNWLRKTYIPDLVCHGKIIVELKAGKALLPEHEAQLINYLKATGLQLGLLVNFGAYPRVAIKACSNRPDYHPSNPSSP